LGIFGFISHFDTHQGRLAEVLSWEFDSAPGWGLLHNSSVGGGGGGEGGRSIIIHVDRSNQHGGTVPPVDFARGRGRKDFE
jgi:hypothetical protein